MSEEMEEVFGEVERLTALHAHGFPPATPAQPISTVYIAADRFSPTDVVEFGAQAERLLTRHASDAPTLAAAFALDEALAARVGPRVAEKLRREPVEDLRVDFEDGYGVRDDGVEDRDAMRAGRALAGVLATDPRPRRAGLRVKSFADGTHRRSVRTLQLFLREVLEAHGGLPDEFAITFPKVVVAGHVRAFATILAALEDELSLPPRSLGFEVQVETPQSIIGPEGALALPGFLAAADGRMRAAHFGVFDYTAALGLPPAEQRLDHPACDAARQLMQVALAGSGVELSDGSTIVTPVDDQTPSVHHAWRRHAADVRHSLAHGYWQGWDLHPAHIVSRFVTVYAFHLADVDMSLARLSAWTDGVAGPSGILEEPATARMLLAQLRRALACGAVGDGDVPASVLRLL